MVTHNKLFRQEALEKTASPERLDQLVQVVSPKRWISLVALGAIVAAGSAWAVLGRIPITVTGKGVLVYPSRVVTVQAPSSGRLLSLKIQAGDRVEKGQVLATIDQSELQNQLQLARDKLLQIRLQDQVATSTQIQRGILDQSATAQQRQSLRQNLLTVQSSTPVLHDKGLDSIQRDRQALQQRLQTLRELLPIFKERWDKRQEIFPAGAISKDDILKVREEYLNKQTEINQAESQLKQLDVKEADAQRQYLQNVNQTNELQSQLKALDSRTATQGEQDLTSATNRKKEIQDTERSIAQLVSQLRQSSEIKSNEAGYVLEVTAKPGQRLEPGAGIGTLSTQTNSDRLVSVVFLPVSDGKKITKTMTVQTTPTTVKREEFGGILGKVTQVSEFPVTQQGAASLVGNPDLLPDIMAKGAYLAVFVELETDSTASGYRWSSSQGPNQPTTQGATTSAQITIDERTPISYVLPILKSLTGMS